MRNQIALTNQMSNYLDKQQQFTAAEEYAETVAQEYHRDIYQQIDAHLDNSKGDDLFSLAAKVAKKSLSIDSQAVCHNGSDSVKSSQGVDGVCVNIVTETNDLSFDINTNEPQYSIIQTVDASNRKLARNINQLTISWGEHKLKDSHQAPVFKKVDSSRDLTLPEDWDYDAPVLEIELTPASIGDGFNQANGKDNSRSFFLYPVDKDSTIKTTLKQSSIDLNSSPTEFKFAGDDALHN